MSQDFFTAINKIITDFESKTNNNRNTGVIYTPHNIVNYIVSNIFKIYFNECADLPKCPNSITLSIHIKQILSKIDNLKPYFIEKLKTIKIIDPACGSGRFLISSAKMLYKIWKILKSGLEDYEIKRNIIQNNIYGVEIDNSAHIITKLQLISWLLSDTEVQPNFYSFNIKDLNLEEINQLIKKIDIKLNIQQLDFLLEFEPEKFDIIIGNPPYVENKRIRDFEYKQKLYNVFKSAYKLFDLSIIFIEKSIELMKDRSVLSFILPNKFLSADYGVKVRELLLCNTEIKEIINISSLIVFKKASTYPVILSFKKGKIDDKNEIYITKFHNYNDFLTLNNSKIMKLPQKSIKNLPSKVIPISGNINLIQFLYTKYKSINSLFKDLKIIYRPFGFLKYNKHFDNISEERKSEKDLLLIGTGNVEKYYIKYNKRIKIAKRDFKISYFNYSPTFAPIWQYLESEKIIFREIAKDLTCVYDPGIFTNITGLYLLTIPSFSTESLFCLLTILNSTLLDTVFKTLFSSLHMAGDYLRFNGSYIKRLPGPHKFPSSLSQCGKIIQILKQLRYDLNSHCTNEMLKVEFLKENYASELDILIRFFKKLSNSMVNLLYLDDFYLKNNHNFTLIREILYSNTNLNYIQFKYLLPQFHLSNYDTYTLEELKHTLDEIKKFATSIRKNKSILHQIDQICKINLSKEI